MNDSQMRSARPSLSQVSPTDQSCSFSVKSISDRKRPKASLDNGTVKVVSSDLRKTFDKTQTQRADEIIEKVSSYAQREPDIEATMQRHLIETKERGNLSFSRDEDFGLDATEAATTAVAISSREHNTMILTE